MAFGIGLDNNSLGQTTESVNVSFLAEPFHQELWKKHSGKAVLLKVIRTK